MEKVRIGNDLKVNFSVYRNGEPESFDGATNISTKIVNESYNKTIAHTYSIVDNVIQFNIDALELKQCGKCRVFISYTKVGDYTVDSPAFELVQYTEDTGGTEVIGIEIVKINISGDIGINRDGSSAYEVWEAYPGNEGKTIEQYFEWLHENPTKIDLDGLNSNIDKLHFKPDTLVQLANIGDVRYSQESRTLEVKVSDTVSIQLGQEMQTRVKNDEAIQINNGQMVYINSAAGANPLAKIASTSNPDVAQKTFGMATENIPANGFGAITTEGLVRDINTSAFPEGSMLWLGTNGSVTNIEPIAPTSKISVGMVLRSNANNGVVYVKIRAIARNQKLSDVYAPTMTGGDVLRWNSTTLRFETFNITSALSNKVDTSRTITAGNGLTGGGDLSADRTINIANADDSLVVASDNIKVNTNNTLTSTSTTRPLSANQGKVLNEKVAQVETDLNKKNIIIDYISDSTFMGVADAGVKPTAGLTNTRITNGTLSDVAGYLQSLTFRANIAGIVKIKFYAKIGANLVWQNEVIITAKSGLNTYYSGLDFIPVYVGAEWYLGAYSPTVEIPYISNTVEQSIMVAGDHTGSIGSTWGYKYYIAISAKIVRSLNEIDSVNTRITGIETEIASIEKKTPITTSTLFLSDFKAGIPTNFVQNGGWTPSIGGLKSPITGGWDVQAYYDIYTSLDKNTIRARIKITDTTSKFALMRKTKSAAAGHLAVIDCANKKLQILRSWNGTSTTIPSVSVEAAITFDFVSNREYLVELIKYTAAKCTLKITDIITNNMSQVVADYGNTTTYYQGNGWDSPGIILVNGDITVKKFEYISNAPTKPILAIYGDSFIEAATILTSINSRYASKIFDELNGNCLICGEGGESSAGLLRKLDTDFMNFSPKYTLIAIGANDNNFSIWLSNMQAAIVKVESRNSIPILATITIRLDVDHNAFTAQANEWIRSSGYKYVDFNLVTTVNNDGITQDTTLFMDDKIHPTIACHDILYKRFLMDCPEVFDEQ